MDSIKGMVVGKRRGGKGRGGGVNNEVPVIFYFIDSSFIVTLSSFIIIFYLFDAYFLTLFIVFLH